MEKIGELSSSFSSSPGFDELDEFLEGVVQERLDRLEMATGSTIVDGHGKESFDDILLKIQKDDATGISIDRDSIKALLLEYEYRSREVMTSQV
ncbi:unnamed protein product [Ilex paraguariensis]|uniref:Uncharacterized protein n=1 Tax=Ilex paraguariensis TaxID=185542 RepID=A0ABC8SEJ2_9AQUA